ncbi:MAG: hypothetical protein ACREDP_14235, partial [Bradyrhizobium sp.]
SLRRGLAPQGPSRCLRLTITNPPRAAQTGCSHRRDRTFPATLVLIGKGADMTQADHYRDQSVRAKRLAVAVRDPEASKKLIEMAEEFQLYAERLEKTV